MDSDNTPSVSSQVEEMHHEIHDEMLNDISNDMPEVEKIPSYVENTDAEEKQTQTQEMPQVEVDDLRRIAIYSDDGKDSLTLASYTSTDGTKRFVLNTIDLPLTDFHRYLRSLTETDCNRHDELFFVGVHASFMTGLVVLLVAFGLALIKNELPYLNI